MSELTDWVYDNFERYMPLLAQIFVPEEEIEKAIDRIVKTLSESERAMDEELYGMRFDLMRHEARVLNKKYSHRPRKTL